MKKQLSSIVFWGAFWGLTEATFGYLLHAFSVNIGWIFWFPLAFYFMSSVYRATNSYISIFLTSLLAAAIKTADFIMPVSPDRIINPAVSILLEGLALLAFYKISAVTAAKRYSNIRTALGIFAASILWRAMYIVYISLMPGYYASISPLRSGSVLLSFLLIESIVNSLLIFSCVKAYKWAGIGRLPVRRILDGSFGLVFSCFMLTIAFYVQWAL